MLSTDLQDTQRLKSELQKTKRRAEHAEQRAETAEGLLASLTEPLEELQTEGNEIGQDLAWMLERYTAYIQRTQEVYALLSNFRPERSQREPMTMVRTPESSYAPASARKRDLGYREAIRSDSPEPPCVDSRSSDEYVQRAGAVQDSRGLQPVSAEHRDFEMSDSHGHEFRSDQPPLYHQLTFQMHLPEVNEGREAPQRQLRFLEPLSETRLDRTCDALSVPPLNSDRHPRLC